MFLSGLKIDEIAKNRGIKENTIVEHIIKNIDHPQITWNKFMNETEYMQIKKAFELRPTSVFIKSFLNGKAEELVKIFQQASPEQKQQAYDLLRMIDATNNEKYLKIISG